jgi:glycolate oxidase iron-sulfur subunit
MKTKLADQLQGSASAVEAAAIIGKCVHCGFCTATCPTYQLLGEELDGPRGRIYLMKQVLEGAEPTRSTQLHLDRCLSCRGCETTCPSGVRYGRLVEIGRTLVEERVARPLPERWLRATLVAALIGPLFAPALRVGQWLRPALPKALRQKIPHRRSPGEWPNRHHARRVLLLSGCVQPAMFPNINSATARVLDALGIETVTATRSGCCGALQQHANLHEAALAAARRNIDAWWPLLEQGAEAIVMNASGCGLHVREYAQQLRHDTDYASKAARISELTLDIVQVLLPLQEALVRRLLAGRKSSDRSSAGVELVVYHPPCTQQHGLGIRGQVELLLSGCGAQLATFRDSHLCCGSAGSYSILQPAIATQLRSRKLEALMQSAPARILSSNIGCIAHLAGAATVPVQHWIEWLDERLANGGPRGSDT